MKSKPSKFKTPCSKSKKWTLFGFKIHDSGHDWVWGMWAIKPYPFEKEYNASRYSYRAGYCCANCGEYHWWENDTTYSLMSLYYQNLEFQRLYHQYMGKDRYGRSRDFYEKCVEFKGKQFLLYEKPNEFIVKCGNCVVCRWSLSDPAETQRAYEMWKRTFGAKIVEAEYAEYMG